MEFGACLTTGLTSERPSDKQTHWSATVRLSDNIEHFACTQYNARNSRDKSVPWEAFVVELVIVRQTNLKDKETQNSTQEKTSWEWNLQGEIHVLVLDLPTFEVSAAFPRLQNTSRSSEINKSNYIALTWIRHSILRIGASFMEKLWKCG